jgi:hypothetical protein
VLLFLPKKKRNKINSSEEVKMGPDEERRKFVCGLGDGSLPFLTDKNSNV